MTRTFLFLSTLMLLVFQVSFASEQSRLLHRGATIDHAQTDSHTPSQTGHSDFVIPGIGWMIEHHGHSAGKFHHEEDGKHHGFCFDRLGRRHWTGHLTCACLKCFLVIMHLLLIAIAFLHQLH